MLQAALDGTITSEHDATMAAVAKQNAPLALVLNIESQAAIDNLDALLAVPGVDGLLIGPHDLTFNLGVPGDFEHPKFQAALRTIFSKARAAGVGAGIHQGKPPNEPGCTVVDSARFLTEGCNVYVHSSDVSLFKTQLQSDLERIRPKREANGGGPPAKKARADELTI